MVSFFEAAKAVMKIALILKPIILNRHNKYEQSYGLSKFMVHSVERNMVKIIDTPCGKAICRSAIMKKMFHSNLLHWKGFRSNTTTTTTTTTIMKNKVLEIFFSDSLVNGLTFWVFFVSVAKKVRPEIFGLHGLYLALGLLASGRQFLRGCSFLFPLFASTSLAWWQQLIHLVVDVVVRLRLLPEIT